MAKQKEHKVEIRNRRASFDYEFLETYIAGISLVSTEIKSIRMGKASLVDSFCYFVGNELFVKGMNVAQYFWGSWGQHEPMRDRKLLLTKRELRHLRRRQGKRPHHRRHQTLHQRQRPRQARHRPSQRQEDLRQARHHQRERPPPRA